MFHENPKSCGICEIPGKYPGSFKKARQSPPCPEGFIL
jgi:hypothetical protein